MIIDLGCGESKEPGAFGIDNVPLPGVDCVHDLLDFPYPFEEGIAEKIFVKHVLEHFLLDEINSILKECFRLLQPGGVLILRVPHVNSVAAWIDPTHKSYYTFGSIQFFVQNTPKAYYLQTQNLWDLYSISSKITWFNWKKYRMKKIDLFLSQTLSNIVNWLLERRDFPGSADLLIKWIPTFFVEIEWQLFKPL